MEHAEAILVAFDLLGAAHEEGLLDLLHGAVGSKDVIFGKIAQYAREPVSTQALRNLLILGKLLGGINAEDLHRVTSPQEKGNPPSLWKIFKQMMSSEGRRGLEIVVTLLTGIGRSAK